SNPSPLRPAVPSHSARRSTLQPLQIGSASTCFGPSAVHEDWCYGCGDDGPLRSTTSDKTGMAACHACMISLRGYCELCRERLSTTAGLIRVRIHKLEIPAHQVLLIIELGPLEIDRALRINDHFDAVELIHLIVLADFLIKIDRIA